MLTLTLALTLAVTLALTLALTPDPGPDPDPAQVGPSPAIMHVSNLKKLAPLWYELSVQMKADREADAAFGWMLEMWGYSVAALRVGVKHFAWQQIQIEPSAAWHQDVNSQARC